MRSKDGPNGPPHQGSRTYGQALRMECMRSASCGRACGRRRGSRLFGIAGPRWFRTRYLGTTRRQHLSVGYDSGRRCRTRSHDESAAVVRRLGRAARRRRSDGDAAARSRRLRRARHPLRAAHAPRASARRARYARIDDAARVWEWQLPRHPRRRGARRPSCAPRPRCTIAVIDTGADLGAPDIAAKAPLACNTRTGTADVRDANGHGTFVASLAAGSVTNGDGIAGAGGDAQLMVVKPGSDGGSFTDVDEAAGIMYAVDHGAKIINLSVGGPTTSTTEQRAIQYAIDHGVLRRRRGRQRIRRRQPGRVSGCAAAAGRLERRRRRGPRGHRLDGGRPRASFANTGSWVSLAAPGEHVFGAVSSASAPLALSAHQRLPGAQVGPLRLRQRHVVRGAAGCRSGRARLGARIPR